MKKTNTKANAKAVATKNTAMDAVKAKANDAKLAVYKAAGVNVKRKRAVKKADNIVKAAAIGAIAINIIEAPVVGAAVVGINAGNKKAMANQAEKEFYRSAFMNAYNDTAATDAYSNAYNEEMAKNATRPAILQKKPEAIHKIALQAKYDYAKQVATEAVKEAKKICKF